MIQTKEREKLGTLLALIFKLQDETSFPDQKQRQEALNKLTLYAQQIGVSIDPNDPEFLPTLMIKILEENSRSIELPPANLPPPELVEIYEKEKQEKEAQIQKAIGSKEAYQDYRNYIDLFKKWILKNKPQLPDQLAQAIAEKSAQRAIASFEPIAQPNVLTEEDETKIFEQVEKIVQEELKKVEFEKQAVVQETKAKPWILPEEFKKTIKTQSVRIAATPQIIRPLKETARITIIPYREIPIPGTIIERLEQPSQEVNFLPIYTLAHPKVFAAWVEKKIYTLPAKLLKIGTEEATPEWQAMAQKGLFTEDYQASIKTLKDWGLSINHPIIKKLEDKVERFKEQQKIIYEIKKGISLIQAWKDTAAARILKHYYHFDKIAGRQKIYDNDLKANLPRLSPNLAWSQGGYAGFLRNTLGRFRFVVRSYEKISKFVTKGKYTSILIPVRNFFSQKITQPVIRWLTKTAAGKAVKTGVKKAAGWLAVKLGVKTGIWAAGAAGAVPSAGVSLLIAVAVEIGTRILGKIKNLLVSIFRDPEKALGSIGIGVLLLVFVPMPIALIGILPIALGGIGLVSFTLAPATLTTIGGGIGAFFTAIATLPFTLPIALFIIILLSVLAGLTLFIVMVVSGAFILPKQVSEVTPTTISPYYSEYFEITKTAFPNKLENYEVEDEDGETIKYTITIKPKGDYILTVNNLEEKFNVFKEGSTAIAADYSDCQFSREDVQEAINNNQSLECFVNIDSRFKNSAISNSVTFQTSVENKVGIHKGMASAIVIIGNPPMLCPKGWPTPHGYITQGPDASYSHGGDEAIDIGGVGNTTLVYATHQGTVEEVGFQPPQKNGKAGAGYFVKISGTCLGQRFYSNYYHLKAGSIKVNTGDSVVAFQPIGVTDCSGMVYCADHLHYEFTPYGGIVKMIYNYVPRTIPRRCDGNCNISW